MSRSRLILTLVFVLGCKPGLDKAISGIETGAVALDVVLDQQAQTWADGVDAQIALCRAEGHETKEARASCMGWAGEGEKVEPIFEKLVEVQAALYDALQTVKALEEQLGPYLEKAKAAKGK